MWKVQSEIDIFESGDRVVFCGGNLLILVLIVAANFYTRSSLREKERE